MRQLSTPVSLAELACFTGLRSCAFLPNHPLQSPNLLVDKDWRVKVREAKGHGDHLSAGDQVGPHGGVNVCWLLWANWEPSLGPTPALRSLTST